MPFLFYLVNKNTLLPWGKTIEQYSWWLVILALLTLTLFQLHALYVYIWLLIIENPMLRPVGWSSNTLHAISRIGYFIAGIIWILVAYIAEYQLHTKRNAKDKRLVAIKYLGVMLTLLILAYIPFLF